MFKWLLIALFSCSFSTIAAEQTQPVSKVTPQEVSIDTHTKSGDLVLGEKEWIYVKELNRNILSRVDTGATSSSISAVDIKTYKKDGKNFVDFKLAHKKWKSKTLTYPVTRWVEVVQSTTDEPSASRPVVQLDVQLGDYKTKTDFTLTDRTHLQYPVLLGRTFIDNVAIVDVSHKYIQPRVKIEKPAKQD
ncbi:ATP-dependent zinc protease family protein [Vibrio gangliei]|uniref:ATP-dependent zinc protease family protein n=1 Tax=Vibrio gangliei TaxID=2077090 RepID=UPI000D01611C|nr:ATP-dependent zinc protease [Vibrio gangliei]